MLYIPTDEEITMGMTYSEIQNLNGVKTPTVLYQGSDVNTSQLLKSLEFQNEQIQDSQDESFFNQEKIGEHLMIIRNGRAHQRNQLN